MVSDLLPLNCPGFISLLKLLLSLYWLPLNWFVCTGWLVVAADPMAFALYLVIYQWQSGNIEMGKKFFLKLHQMSETVIEIKCSKEKFKFEIETPTVVYDPSICFINGTFAGTPPFTIPHPIGKYKSCQSIVRPRRFCLLSNFNVLCGRRNIQILKN